MKIRLLISSLLFTNILIAQTVGDILKTKYPNYRYIMYDMPFIKWEPEPITEDFYNLTLSEIIENKNKFTFNNNLKKDKLLERINYVLIKNGIFKSVKINDDGKSNFVINATVISEFTSIFAGNSYPKISKSDIKIRVKDNAYQIEVIKFAVGNNEGFINNYRNILREIFSDSKSGTISALTKKEAQQDWNSTFLDYSKKLQILNNSINENNEF